LPKQPKTKDFKSLWRDIVQVYRTLQGSKCIYCETMIEGDIANDIEHFRPKAKVAVWKPPQIFVTAGVTPTPPAGPKGDPGYRDLAYHPWNYAASCKVCNTVLKKNYFPIAGTRQSTATDPRKMKSEQAYFIYPIGDFDDNPQSLMRFDGMHPEPTAPQGAREYLRAIVTIEVFQLNDAVRRKELFRARALLLRALYKELLTNSDPASTLAHKAEADRWIAIYLDPRQPHTNWLKCLKQAFDRDRSEAAKWVANAAHFLSTGSLSADGPS